MAMSGADVWMQVPAQQNSQPDVMSAYLAHIVAGLPDAEYISQCGNRLLAELWLEQLAQAAIDPCPADVNFDGAADILDLLEYLDAFGSQRAWADVNGDEAVDILDLLDYLDGFGEGCP